MRALLAAGFTVRHRAKGVSVLERAGRCVVVPEIAMMAPEMMAAILRSAGLDELEVGGRTLRSGTFARPVRDDPPSSREP